MSYYDVHMFHYCRIIPITSIYLHDMAHFL